MWKGSIGTMTWLPALVTASLLSACAREPESPQPTDMGENPPVAEAQDAKSFAIGEFTAIALSDGGLAFPNDNSIFGVGRTPAEVAAVLKAARLPTDDLHLSIQPLLVKAAERVLLFDTGAGPNFGASAGKLMHTLEASRVDPGDVTDIFVSHAHGDHVGGLVSTQGGLAFPNAAIHISSPEWAWLKGMSTEAAAGFGIKDHAALVGAITPKLAEFAPGTEIIPGVVKAVAIRGHTPGHSGYLITSGENTLLYIADAMHHFVVSVQKPEWTLDFDANPATAKASRQDLLAQSAANGQRLYAVHFPFPGVGKIERRGEGFVWVPE